MATWPRILYPHHRMTTINSSTDPIGNYYSFSNRPHLLEYGAIPGGQGFCAGGLLNSGGNNDTSVIATSANGTTWIGASSNPLRYVNIISYGSIARGWLACGRSESNYPIFATSPDGSAWSLVESTPFITMGNIYSIAYGPPGWLVVGLEVPSNNNIMCTTTDGHNWTQLTPPSDLGTIFHAAYGTIPGGSGWLVAGNTKVATSPDGFTWTSYSVGGTQLYTVTFGKIKVNGILTPGWLALSYDNGSALSMSTTGATWTRILSHPFIYIRNIFWNGQYWLISGQQAGSGGIQLEIFATSPDGNTWTISSTYPFLDGSIGGIAYGSSKWCAFGWGMMKTTLLFTTSSDADIWTLNSPGSINIRDLENQTISVNRVVTVVLPSNQPNIKSWFIRYPLSDINGVITYSILAYGLAGSTVTFTYDGKGYLEATFPKMVYFSNKADAIANINFTGVSLKYIIGNLDNGSIGAYNVWSIASNPGGSFTASSQAYPNGFEFTPTGTFNLYPAAPPPSTFTNIPVALSYATYSLPSINAQVITLNLLIANIKLVSGISLTAKTLTAQTKKNLAGYTSICIGDAIYNNNKTTYNLGMLNQSMLVITQYLLPAKTATTDKAIQTIFAKFLLAINSNKTGLSNALALLTTANACYTKADALCKATGTKVAAAKTAFTSSVKTLNASAATMLATVKKVQTTLASNNSAMIAIFNL